MAQLSAPTESAVKAEIIRKGQAVRACPFLRGSLDGWGLWKLYVLLVRFECKPIFDSSTIEAVSTNPLVFDLVYLFF